MTAAPGSGERGADKWGFGSVPTSQNSHFQTHIFAIRRAKETFCALSRHAPPPSALFPGSPRGPWGSPGLCSAVRTPLSMTPHSSPPASVHPLICPDVGFSHLHALAHVGSSSSGAFLSHGPEELCSSMTPGSVAPPSYRGHRVLGSVGLGTTCHSAHLAVCVCPSLTGGQRKKGWCGDRSVQPPAQGPARSRAKKEKTNDWNEQEGARCFYFSES